MELKYLLKDEIYQSITGMTDNIDIKEITNDSRKCKRGSLYFAVPGAVVNGAEFIPECIDAGVSCIITECGKKDIEELIGNKKITEINIPIVKVENIRCTMGRVSSLFYGEPSKKLTVIGITGTKGKTTTSYMIREMLIAAGHKTGLAGTIEIIDGKTRTPSVNTTPESIILHKKFRDMVENGLDSVVMEVSSQALKLDRVSGVDFDYGIFTNLSPDHIGKNEHASYEEYRDCKKKLFSMCKTGIFNIDDEEADYMKSDASCKILTFGKKTGSDYEASGHELFHRDGELGIAFELKGKKNMHIEVGLPGEFSIHNSLAAIAVADSMNVPMERIAEILKTIKVRGRVEMLPISTEFTFMIDYAHNGMALKSLLTAIHEYHPKRIITIFGCGGNRAKSRRYEMGEASGKYSDFTIITSDNPRFEEPEEIMNDIETGIKKTGGKYIKVTDRKEAVRYGIMNAVPGDVVILAGKGHEDYQEIKGVKYHMDEREIVKEVLEEEDATKICGYNNRYLA